MAGGIHQSMLDNVIDSIYQPYKTKGKNPDAIPEYNKVRTVIIRM